MAIDKNGTVIKVGDVVLLPELGLRGTVLELLDDRVRVRLHDHPKGLQPEITLLGVTVIVDPAGGDHGNL